MGGAVREGFGELGCGLLAGAPSQNNVTKHSAKHHHLRHHGRLIGHFIFKVSAIQVIVKLSEGKCTIRVCNTFQNTKKDAAIRKSSFGISSFIVTRLTNYHSSP